MSRNKSMSPFDFCILVYSKKVDNILIWQCSTYHFLLFGQCVLVGDSDGSVSVLQLKSMPYAPENQVCKIKLNHHNENIPHVNIFVVHKPILFVKDNLVLESECLSVF